MKIWLFVMHLFALAWNVYGIGLPAPCRTVRNLLLYRDMGPLRMIFHRWDMLNTLWLRWQYLHLVKNLCCTSFSMSVFQSSLHCLQVSCLIPHMLLLHNKSITVSTLACKRLLIWSNSRKCLHSQLFKRSLSNFLLNKVSVYIQCHLPKCVRIFEIKQIYWMHFLPHKTFAKLIFMPATAK